jgi:Ser/Thr protein kinase RdoA (MazF antagonist)
VQMAAKSKPESVNFLLPRLQFCNLCPGLNELPCRAPAEIHPAAMSPEVYRLFSPEIRDECFSRFRVTAARLISNWHAFTFETETPAGPCILKITHSFHRTEDQVEAETDWMLFLVSRQVGVPRTNAERVVQCVKNLPLSDFQYGLIHADVYQENLFWAKGDLLLFDFDNCEYGHYVSDIAIALYAALWRDLYQPDPAQFSERFLRALMLGYREEHALSRTEIEALPLFLQLREVLIYTVAKKMLDANNLTPIQARLLAQRGDRIRKNQPIVDLRAVLKSL